MLHPDIRAGLTTPGHAVLQVIGGESPDLCFVPLRQTTIEGEVAGPLASLRLVQEFGFTREQCTQGLEAVYRFPLPANAAVTGLVARFGETEVVAELQERVQAEAEYEDAKRLGRQAALATRESPDVFTMQLAGLQPDEPVTVTIDFLQLAASEGEGWALRLPLTTAPRFVREDELGSRHAAGQPLAIALDPGHRASLRVTFRQAAVVASPTHLLAVQGSGGDLAVGLLEGEVRPDRDLVLQWQPRGEKARPALQVFGWHEAAEGTSYLMALVAPPAQPAASLPREVILLVDHSGSMAGDKAAGANRCALAALQSLGPADRWALGTFHTTPRWLRRSLLPGGQGLAEARRFLADDGSGGTELGLALEQALSLPRSPGQCSRQVLVITDGQITDLGRLLRLVEREAGRPDRRRVSVVSVDCAPNDLLVSRLVEHSGGVARFLQSDPAAGDIAQALSEVLADWSRPVCLDARLLINRSSVACPGRHVVSQDGASQVELGDLVAGRPAWVMVAALGEGLPALELVDGDGKLLAHSPGPVTPSPACRALVGAHRVLALEWLMHSHLPPAGMAGHLRELSYPSPDISEAVYEENEYQAVFAHLRELLVRESLRYGLACAETAFIAVRQEAGKPVERQVLVPNALPWGWESACMSGSAYGDTCCMAAGCDVHGALPQQCPGPDVGAWEMVFHGSPVFCGDTAVLAEDFPAEGLPIALKLKMIYLVLDGDPPSGRLEGAFLDLFAGDPAAPAARIPLLELLAEPPITLDIEWRQGELFRLVLTGVKTPDLGACQLLVMISWDPA